MVSTRIRDVTDGSSNTVIAAEQSGLVDERDCRSGHHGGWSGFQNVGVWDVSFYSSIHYPFGTGVTTMLYPINYNVLDVGTNTSYDANTVVNSFHSGGINVLFVDGSVHFVSDSADRELQKRLFSRNDGTPVGEF